MASAVKLSDDIISEAKVIYIAKENPDLTYEFIKNIFIARQEVQSDKLEPYTLSKKI